MSKYTLSFLTPEEIQQFKVLTLKIKGIQLTDQQAADQGERLIRSFELMLSPLVSQTDSVNNESDRL